MSIFVFVLICLVYRVISKIIMNKKPVLSKNEKKNTIASKKKSKIVLKNVLVQPFEKFCFCDKCGELKSDERVLYQKINKKDSILNKIGTTPDEGYKEKFIYYNIAGRDAYTAGLVQRIRLNNMSVCLQPELSVADVDQFVEIFQMQYNLSSSPKKPSSTSEISSQLDDNNLPKEFDHKLKVGLQSSIRSISSGATLALFISTKIKPKHIVDQIVFMALAQNKNSKIFCVPNMDEALLNVLGFSCQCLAMLESENQIWNWILEKSKQFPVPWNYFHEKLTKMEQMDVDCSESPGIVRLKEDKVDFSKLYLLKESSNERAFIPHGAVSKNLANRADSCDFISLGEMSQNISKVGPTKEMIRKMQRMGNTNVKGHSKFKKLSLSHDNSKVNYVSLKINRVQPNPDKNRNKKKKKNKK